MIGNNFLENRDQFARDIGVPNLYEFIDQYPLYAGVHTLANKIWCYELLHSTVGVPGDIIEFGSWRGANLMFLAKMSCLLEPHSPKQILGFDNFEGLPASVDEDGEYAKSQVGRYMGNEKVIKQAIRLFELEEKVQLIIGDALKTIPRYASDNPHTLTSFAYLDFDLYEPTKTALRFLDKSISVGGVIVFDEACTKEWPGETLAMKEFMSSSIHKFEMLSNKISRQPTLAIRRID